MIAVTAFPATRSRWCRIGLRRVRHHWTFARVPELRRRNAGMGLNMYPATQVVSAFALEPRIVGVGDGSAPLNPLVVFETSRPVIASYEIRSGHARWQVQPDSQ